MKIEHEHNILTGRLSAVSASISEWRLQLNQARQKQTASDVSDRQELETNLTCDHCSSDCQIIMSSIIAFSA